MSYIYQMRGVKAQFTRFQRSLRLFRASTTLMEGERKVFKAWTQPLSGARPTKSNYEGEFPPGRKIDAAEYYVTWSDLCEIQSTINFSGLAEAKTESRKAAIWRLANKLVAEADNDFGTLINMLLHLNARCTLAEVEAVYDTDGTSYTNGSTSCYIKIDQGSISRFFVGQYLDIRQGSSTSSLRIEDCYVRDVFPDNEGPGGTRGQGPGIIVSHASSNFDAVADGDEIVLSDVTNDNFWSFPTWFSRSDDVVNLTRTDVGNAWTIPHIKWWDSNNDGTGTATTLDLETHLGEIAEELAYSIEYGRQMRAAEGIELTTNAMTLLATPRLVSEASRQVGDQIQYVSRLGAPERQKYFGVTGFDGAFWHHPLLGPIAFQADPVATPGVMRLLEPNSWRWVIGHRGGLGELEWLDRDGSRFHYQYGSNGRLKNTLIAGALMRLQLICDQPKANVQGGGLKSSLE